MTATSHNFGHPIYYDENNGVWCWTDNQNPIDSEKRKCPRCNQYQTKKGYDPCLGYIKNATSVCCGHGVSKPIFMVQSEII
jgi:hypothetical protein